MASAEHKSCSDFIKSAHQRLREAAKVVGPDEAWLRHLEDEESLRNYAFAMRDLGATHWESSYQNSSKSISRIQWACQHIQEYFCEKGLLKHRLKEIDVADKIQLEMKSICCYGDIPSSRIKLLDVGSCYNPFRSYSYLEVTPIDIAPASEDVFKCDFLNTDFGSGAVSGHNLKIETFDVVVFSLVLEYLPSPQQRLKFCENAYKLLKFEGILIIITPDSKHVGANAKYMKSWRFILAKLGFMRIKYEKLAYLHCMVFRKSQRIELSERWCHFQKKVQFFDEMVIPQDFYVGSLCKPQDYLYDNCDVDLFKHLPG